MIGTPSRLHPRSKSPSRLRRFALLAAATIGLPLLSVAAIEAYMAATTRGVIHDQIAAVPRRRVAIVFGAQVLPSGRPSQALAHRLDAAVALYRDRVVERLLLTGDGGASEYDEPAAMRAYVLARGVPDSAIVRDPGGFRTYDSCYRARAVFGIGPDEAILVTQAYHLPRAVYTCARLGVRANGFVAAPFGGPRGAAAERREHPARWLAWWEVTVTRPTPRQLPGDG